jgi:hypothetical protein
MTEKRFIQRDVPLLKVPRKKIALFVGLQAIGVAATVAISQTIAAIGQSPPPTLRPSRFLSQFLCLLNSVDRVTDLPLPTGFPVLIILLIPLRWFWMPKWFNRRDLQIMDDLTANNEAVLASLGGAPTMPEKEDLREKESQRRYRSEDWGRERRYSESKGGVKRQRAGSHHRS